MVRPPCFDSNGMKKGAWSKEEDKILKAHVEQFGHHNWRLLPELAGLTRCGKSCRLRWVNYLKPSLKRGKFTKHEEDLIIKLRAQLGNQWSAIAAKLPGRTDNEVKNHWHAHINKRSKRSRAVARVKQSSETNYCTTDDHHKEKLPASENVFPPELSTENPENTDGLINSVADSYSVVEPYDQTCFSQLMSIDLPPFPEEDEFYDFGSCQNDMYSTFFNSSSSDDGITNSWNSSSAESHGNFWCELLGEDEIDMVLWSIEHEEH